MPASIRRFGLFMAVAIAFGLVVFWNNVAREIQSQSKTKPGLIAQWNMKNVGKVPRVADQVGKLDGNILGEPQWLTSPSALLLQKSDAGLLIREKVTPVDSFLPKTALTVATWARLDAGHPDGGIVSLMQDNGDFERGWSVGYNDSSFVFRLAAQKADGTAPRLTQLVSKTPFEKGKWAFVVATYDSKTMRLYVNGKETAASDVQSGPISYAPSAPFIIGRYRDDNEDYPMEGAIKEVSLYDRALDANEIKELFEPEQNLIDIPVAPSPLRFVIAPYLQFPTQESMTIMWETSLPSNSVVEYGPTLNALKKIEIADPKSIHEVKITDLTPETKYVYRVSSKAENSQTLTSDLFQFMTAVKEDSSFSFTVVGDTQANPVITGKIAKLMYERRPHFVMHCGDVVDAGANKRMWVHELFGPCAQLFARVPVFPTIGNHEKNHENYYKYFSLPSPEYCYRYRYGNADFFVIDSNKGLKPDSEQFKWLDEQLGKSTATWKFVYHHHPAWSSDSNDYGDTSKGLTTLGDLNVRNLVSLYEKHKVDIVFNGHIHLYERTWPLREGKVNRKNGVTYVTSGGGGGGLEDFGPLPSWFKAQLRVDFHYCNITIQGTQLNFSAIDQNGGRFDSFEIVK